MLIYFPIMATLESSSARVTGSPCPHGESPATCEKCAKDAKASIDSAGTDERSAQEKEAAEVERYRDARLEFLLAEHAEFINEGNNGAIYKLTLDELPEELQKEL